MSGVVDNFSIVPLLSDLSALAFQPLVKLVGAARRVNDDVCLMNALSVLILPIGKLKASYRQCLVPGLALALLHDDVGYEGLAANGQIGLALYIAAQYGFDGGPTAQQHPQFFIPGLRLVLML